MQKALERMNIKLHHEIASLAGMSGLAVVRAIVAGERSPEALLGLCDQQIRSPLFKAKVAIQVARRARKSDCGLEEPAAGRGGQCFRFGVDGCRTGD
jgi:hypothetical protein